MPSERAPIPYTWLAHIHILVDDLDEASTFYREVMDFVEMQSHHNLTNRGLARYYGFDGDPEDFEVNLRFLMLPEVMTIKLVNIRTSDPGYPHRSPRSATQYQTSDRGSRGYASGAGVGPISVAVEDLEGTYEKILEHARDYSSEYDMQLLSEPTFLSPLLPHQIGTTKHSALREADDVIDEIAETFPKRAKFQLIDPFGVRWEFNNAII